MLNMSFLKKGHIAGPALAVAAILAVATACVTARAGAAHEAASCRASLVFFDLGNTLIDTKTNDYAKIFYMPGALAYLNELRARGTHLGLISNIPESWGKTREEKLATFRKFVADRWTDPAPMIWDAFDLGILIPMTDAERKPAPVLFRQALAIADERGGCPVIYQGDGEEELKTARELGIRAYLTGSETAPRFMPVEQIDPK